MSDISSDPVDDKYERERYDAKIENWRKTDPEAAAAFDERHSDISSDPVPAREHQAGVCGARGVTTGSYAPCCHLPAGHAGMHNSGGIVPQTWFEPRDISSDPDEALTYIDDEYLRRDISSVTGSDPDNEQFVDVTVKDLRAHSRHAVARIEREAVEPYREALQDLWREARHGASTQPTRNKVRALLEGKTDE